MSLNSIIKKLEEKYLYRESLLYNLRNLILENDEQFPSAIYIFGHSGTGKTSIMKDIMHYYDSCDCLKMCYLNCVECYTMNALLQRILNEVIGDCNDITCESLEDFIDILQTDSNDHANRSYVIVLDNAERLRDIHTNAMSFMLRLRQLSHLNVCVVLIGQIPFEKYYCKSGIPDDVIKIHCAQYTKNQILHIISQQFETARNFLRFNVQEQETGEKLQEKLQIIDSINVEFFRNYLNMLLSILYKICRHIPELKSIAYTCFVTYIDPVLNNGIQMDNISYLWRNSSTCIRSALGCNIWSLNMNQKAQNVDMNTGKFLDIPYYGKCLLVAAYLASHKSAKEDKRLFVKNTTTKISHRTKVALKKKDNENITAMLMGPKSFTIDRLLAIFYAIQNENKRVPLSCNLLSQLSTLIHLKFINIVSGENNVDESTKLQCNIDLEYIAHIGKCIDFNICEYL